MPEDLVITDDQEVIDWCNQLAPDMIDLWEKFHKNRYHFILEHHKDSGVLKTMNGLLTLEPHIKKVEKLVGVDEVPAFRLIEWKVHPSSRMHPEELEDVTVSIHTNPIDAVHAMAKFIAILDVDAWFRAQYPEPDFSDIEDF